MGRTCSALLLVGQRLLWVRRGLLGRVLVASLHRRTHRHIVRLCFGLPCARRRAILSQALLEVRFDHLTAPVLIVLGRQTLGNDVRRRVADDPCDVRVLQVMVSRYEETKSGQRTVSNSTAEGRFSASFWRHIAMKEWNRSEYLPESLSLGGGSVHSSFIA